MGGGEASSIVYTDLPATADAMPPFEVVAEDTQAHTIIGAAEGPRAANGMHIASEGVAGSVSATALALAWLTTPLSESSRRIPL